jgi:hypothetical protein
LLFSSRPAGELFDQRETAKTDRRSIFKNLALLLHDSCGFSAGGEVLQRGNGVTQIGQKSSGMVFLKGQPRQLLAEPIQRAGLPANIVHRRPVAGCIPRWTYSTAAVSGDKATGGTDLESVWSLRKS